MTDGHTTRESRHVWPLVGAAYGLHALGLVLDMGYHAAHPHGAAAPLWAHLPIYAGAVVLLVAVAALVRGDPDDGWLRLALAGAVLEVLALTWSVSVSAEANDFYVPAVLGTIGGAVTLVAIARTWLRRRRAAA